MIQSNFQILFKVEVLHSYFDQNICPCLKFNPGSVTSKLLDRFDFKCRSKINGFDLYANSRASVTAFLNYITKATNQTYFDFGIVTTNSHFNFFTDLPVDWVGQLDFDSQAASNRYEGNAVQLSQGLSKNAGTSRLGNLILRFNDILKFQNNNGFTQFDIRFAARSTQWQYFVINKSSIQLDNPAIGKTDMDFTGPENVFIESGQQALLFSSGDNLIPLSELPKYKFNLINKPASGGNETTRKISAPKIIYTGLPNPDPGRIGMTRINGKNQVSSPMYVFI